MLYVLGRKDQVEPSTLKMFRTFNNDDLSKSDTDLVFDEVTLLVECFAIRTAQAHCFRTSAGVKWRNIIWQRIKI